MAHWYRFTIPQVGVVVCRADRKAEIEKVLAPAIQFGGCVAREKIGDLRRDPHHVVFNSVPRLKSLLLEVAPYLLRQGIDTQGSQVS